MQDKWRYVHQVTHMVRGIPLLSLQPAAVIKSDVGKPSVHIFRSYSGICFAASKLDRNSLPLIRDYISRHDWITRIGISFVQ